MEKILHKKDLKIVVKMTNHNYTSINDIFEKSGPGRFMSDREKAFLLKEQQKRERLKMSMPKRIPGRDLILGYQKKLFVTHKMFHEDLLRNEFELSDEDQDGMLGRIEGEYNYDHRSNIFTTGTISITVNKPHATNKIMNANYHANIRANEALKELEEFERQQAIIKQQEEANRKNKHKVVVLHDVEEPVPPKGPLEGNAWQRIQRMNFSQNASVGISLMPGLRGSRSSMSIKRTNASSMGQSMMQSTKKIL